MSSNECVKIHINQYEICIYLQTEKKNYINKLKYGLKYVEREEEKERERDRGRE